MYACNGILFNHESPIRGETFVTRKITRAVAKISLDLQEKLFLGNLDSRRDWWHAKDYVDAMWRMLQQSDPEDYVIATGVSHTVRDFVNWSFEEIGVALEWKGEWVDEKWYDTKTGKILVEVDPQYFRPAEVDFLLWDSTKARTQLAWEPQYTVRDMCREMVASDRVRFKKQEILKKHGYEILERYE